MNLPFPPEVKRKARWAEQWEVGGAAGYVDVPTLRCVARKGGYSVVVAWPNQTYSLIDAKIGEVELKSRTLAEGEEMFEYLGPGEIRATHWVSFGPETSARW